MTHLRLSTLFLVQGLATGIVYPFLVLMLAERGWAPEGIGLVLGLSAVASLVAFPSWGYLADARMGRGTVLRVAALVAAASGLLLAAGVGSVPATAVAVIGMAVGTSAWGPVADAVALSVPGAESVDYGRIRRWTSFGWVVAALGAGAVYALVGPALLPIAFAVASLGVALAAVSGPSGGTRPAGAPRSGPQRGGARAFLGLARQSPALGPFLLGLFVMAIGSSAAFSFLPLQLVSTGGGPLLVGLASALPALVEIPFFSWTGTLAARMGLRGLFAVGVALSVMQLLVVAAAPDPWVITAVRTVDGAAYALRYASIVLIVGACLPERVRAMGLSSVWFVSGAIAPIIGDPVGGLIYGRLGGPALFATGAVVVSLGAAIAWASLRGPSFAATRHQESEAA